MTHPITPPPELVQQWNNEAVEEWAEEEPIRIDLFIATRAAQWGADQELEACCGLLVQQGFDLVDYLRAARRPKPPSLKEQALLAIDTAVADDRLSADVASVVRRALEQLDD